MSTLDELSATWGAPVTVIDAPIDGSDCTQIILDQIASAPDHSVIRFPVGQSQGKYRCDRSIRVEGRRNLTIEGPSPQDPATFWTNLKVNRTDHPWAFVQNPAVPTSYGVNSQRQHWVLSNCTAMVMRNLRVEGPNDYRDAKGYTKITAPWEAEHAFFLPGSDGVLIEDCSAFSPYGDGVLLGAGPTHTAGPKNVVVRRFSVESPGRCGIGLTRCNDVLLDAVTVAKTGTGGLSFEPNGPMEYAHHIEARYCRLDARLPCIPAQGWRQIDDVWIHHCTFAGSGNATSWPLIRCVPLTSDVAERNNNWIVEDNELLFYGTGGAFKFEESDNITIRRNHLGQLGKFRAAVILDRCGGPIEITDNDFGQCIGLYEATNGSPAPSHSGNTWASGTQTD